MVVRGKGRRKISVGDTEYIWYVEMDYDSPYHILHIVSMDKHLILACPIVSETPYIISKGKVFQNKNTMEFGIDIYYHLIFLRLLHHHLWQK